MADDKIVQDFLRDVHSEREHIELARRAATGGVPAHVVSNANEAIETQAKRWTRSFFGPHVDDLSTEHREFLVASMIPFVREAQAAVIAAKEERHTLGWQWLGEVAKALGLPEEAGLTDIVAAAQTQRTLKDITLQISTWLRSDDAMRLWSEQEDEAAGLHALAARVESWDTAGEVKVGRVCSCGAPMAQHEAHPITAACDFGSNGGKVRRETSDTTNSTDPAKTTRKLRIGPWNASPWGGANAYDEHGHGAASVSKTEDGYLWSAARPFAPAMTGVSSTEAEAKTDAKAVLATWADISMMGE